jgi:hypothetical protein
VIVEASIAVSAIASFTDAPSGCLEQIGQGARCRTTFPAQAARWSERAVALLLSTKALAVTRRREHVEHAVVPLVTRVFEHAGIFRPRP